MKKQTLIRRLGAATLAVGLCAAVGVGTTLAYYTDSTSAVGALEYSYSQPTTEITEEASPEQKIVSIENTGDAPVLVRAKFQYADANAKIEVTGDNWALDEDGWLYYMEPLWEKGGFTENITASIKVSDNAPKNFSITVIQQCAELYWDKDANDYAADFAGKGQLLLGQLDQLKPNQSLTGEKVSD